MGSTQDWLRYIESKRIFTKYNIKGYSGDKDDKEDSKSEDKNEE